MPYKFTGKYGDDGALREMFDYVKERGYPLEDSVYCNIGGYIAFEDNSSMQNKTVAYLKSLAVKGSMQATKGLGEFFERLDDRGIDNFQGETISGLHWLWYYHAYMMGLDECRDKFKYVEEFDLEQINTIIGMPLDFNRAGYIKRSLNPKSKTTASSKSERSGCYIATAVYGSYNAPQVLVLRRFRDDTLAQSLLGRLLIKLYYSLSPPVAEWLKNTHRINTSVRNLLDIFVAWLDKK